MENAAGLDFATHGAELFPAALRTGLPELSSILAHLPPHRAGIRISGIAALQKFLTPGGPIGAIAANILGPGSRPVRAILFDKTATQNWSLAWHQDRTICVKQRLETPGFGPWTVKAGMPHVAPPFALLARMATLRVHLDDVPETNAPLLIAPGSHTAGRVPEQNVESIVRRCGAATCFAQAGDIWLYATPILHASEPATAPTRRRVLQLDFAAEELPGGLEWLGV